MNFARLLEIIGRYELAIDAQVAEGDRLAAQYPELAEAWAVERAKLLAARDDASASEKYQEAFAGTLATIVAGHGPVGGTHAHGG